ncbi:MAG: hypothetical protein ACFE8E_13285 [Candidatus Hodarchaeota archaeon]
MKPIFQEFFCTVCGQSRTLKVKDMCLDCRDNQILNELQHEDGILFNKVP